MRSNTIHTFFRVAAAVGFIGVGLTSSARADQWDKKTILTVNEPIQVRETLLPPGQYVFKLLDSQSDRHIVQIFNYDQSRIIDTELAIPNYRLEPTGHSRFSFWETPEGRVRAMRAWFYPGDNFGQEFPYPKNLAMAKTSTATISYKTMEPEPSPSPAAAVVAETTAPAAQPDTVAAVEAPQPAPVPDAAPSEPTPTPAPAPVNSDSAETLPKTATLYPLAGLAGFLSLACFGFLRRKVA